MCGIAGILTDKRPLDDRKAVVEEMLTRLAHRGPDGSGMVSHPRKALLGHCRLAVIDIKNGGQPMISDDGRYTLIFNGEIYNYLELRQQLVEQGCSLHTHSDTEVLLRLLIYDGMDAVKRLNGMFAFVFHDRDTNEWLAARDHFGIKPFYYTLAPDEFIFASEIKALLVHPQVQAKRDDKALQQYLTFQFCLSERTLFDGIAKISPGHILSGRGSEIISDTSYWELDYRVDRDHTQEYFTESLRNMLFESVRLQLRSDVPLGGYLSGGLDSSLICSLATDLLQKPIDMFHGRFAEGLDYDESFYAKELARAKNGIYQEVVPTAEGFVRELPDLIYMLDEPLAGPGLFPQYQVSRLAREYVTVALGGQGGDEIFGGYARYLVGYLEQALKGAIFETQEEGNHLVTLESIIPQLPLLKQYHPLLSNFWSKGLFEPMDARYFSLVNRIEDRKGLLSDDVVMGWDDESLFGSFQQIFNHPDTISYINKMTHFDQKTLLPALLQVEDRVSMSVSLESRVPFLDYRIVDLVTTMPPPLKFQGGRTKHILKKAANGIVPDTILERKDKMGFPVPLREWMSTGPVRDFVADVLLSRASLERGIYRKDALRNMIRDQGVGGRQIWGALCLELWHRRFMDG